MTTETQKTTFLTPIFRLSFPHLAEPRKKDKPEDVSVYDAVAIVDPADLENPKEMAKWQALNKFIEELRQTKFKDIKSGIKMPIKDDARRKSLEQFNPPEYHGMYTFLMTSREFQPGIGKRQNGKTVELKGAEQKELYAGCYCIATVKPFAYTNQSKGIAIGLNNIVKVREGTPLANRRSLVDDFNEVNYDDYGDEDEDLSEEDVDMI